MGGNGFSVGFGGGVGGGGGGLLEILQAMQIYQSPLYTSQGFGGRVGSSGGGTLEGRGQMRPRRRGGGKLYPPPLLLPPVKLSGGGGVISFYLSLSLLSIPFSLLYLPFFILFFYGLYLSCLHNILSLSFAPLLTKVWGMAPRGKGERENIVKTR